MNLNDGVSIIKNFQNGSRIIRWLYHITSVKTVVSKPQTRSMIVQVRVAPRFSASKEGAVRDT